MIHFFQDLVASLDLHFPWLLPVLEGIEHAVPAPVRLLICGSLTLWIIFLRKRHAATTSGLHLVLL